MSIFEEYPQYEAGYKGLIPEILLKKRLETLLAANKKRASLIDSRSRMRHLLSPISTLEGREVYTFDSYEAMVERVYSMMSESPTIGAPTNYGYVRNGFLYYIRDTHVLWRVYVGDTMLEGQVNVVSDAPMVEKHCQYIQTDLEEVTMPGVIQGSFETSQLQRLLDYAAGKAREMKMFEKWTQYQQTGKMPRLGDFRSFLLFYLEPKTQSIVIYPFATQGLGYLSKMTGYAFAQSFMGSDVPSIRTPASLFGITDEIYKPVRKMPLFVDAYFLQMLVKGLKSRERIHLSFSSVVTHLYLFHESGEEAMVMPVQNPTKTGIQTCKG